MSGRAALEQRFGEARSLLHASPTAQHFEAICALVDRWPDEDHLRHVVLPYLCDGLDAWPVALRKLPPAVRATIFTGKVPASAALCVELDLSYHYFLSTQRLTTASLSRLFQSEWLAWSATTLSVSNHPIGDQAMRALIASPLFTSLEELTLSYTCVSASGLEALATAGRSSSIARLCLSHLDLDDRAVAALCAGEALGALRELDLARNHLGDRSAELLAQRETFTHLERIDLSFNDLSDHGAFALAASESLRRVARLALDYNDVGLAGWRALMHAPNFWRAEISCYPTR